MTVLIPGTILFRVGDLVAELGGDPVAMLARHRIDLDAVEDFRRYVPYEAAGAVLGDGVRQFDCPEFGLRLGGIQGVVSLGPLGVILRNSTTVGEAVLSFCGLLRNLAPADDAGLVRTQQSAAYTYSTILDNAFDRQQMVEKNQALAMHAFRTMIGESFTPMRVTFQHQRLAPHRTYREVFGPRVEFGAEVNAIHLAPLDLARALPDRDEAALALAHEYVAQMQSGLPLVERVREIVRRLLLVNEATLQGVARAVALHERTLQRELALHEVTFEGILDDLRRSRAWELAATGMQVAQISQALGYSEQSSFTRACRRWYHCSPRTLVSFRRGQDPSQPMPSTLPFS